MRLHHLEIYAAAWLPDVVLSSLASVWRVKRYINSRSTRELSTQHFDVLLVVLVAEMISVWYHWGWMHREMTQMRASSIMHLFCAVYVVGLISTCIEDVGVGCHGHADTDVVELDPKSFRAQVMRSSAIWMVEFYAPWFGHVNLD